MTPTIRPRTALRIVWLLFALLIAVLIAMVALPAVAQAPQVDLEIRYHLDENTGLAVLPEKTLLLMQALNQQLAAEVQRLRDKTGCI